MRIAVYENLPPGGALRTSYEIGRQLIRRGHTIDLFRLNTYADKGQFDLARDASSVQVIGYHPFGGRLDERLRTGHLAPRSYTLFGPLKRVHREIATRIKDGKYDCVWVNPDAMLGAPYVLRWLADVPTILYLQEPPRFNSESAVLSQHHRNLAQSGRVIGPLRLLEDKLVMDRLVREERENTQTARVILVNSVYSRERVWAAYARNAIVCYLGIDPDRFLPARDGDRRHEALSVGAPIDAKGHELIIEAIGTIPKESRPALRIVLPRSTDSARLKAAAASRQVELQIESGLSDEEVVERYQHALLTVCAARLEPFGLTPVESMACGTPVVAIREAGYRESVIDGVTGILTEPDAGSLAAAITKLARDPALAASMGKAGREDAVKRWTWDRTGLQVDAILRDLAGH